VGARLIPARRDERTYAKGIAARLPRSFYFHNCMYDSVWHDSLRRQVEQAPVLELTRTYDASWRAVLVGDASMSSMRSRRRAATSERWNNEPGET
jgi:uncharacterized protein with von Willebrand factor type A (vWA) domain